MKEGTQNLIIAGGQAAAQVGGQLFGQKRQYKFNRKLQQHQADINEKYLQNQLEYDSPVNQMKRYEEAGLNKHLIYGQGSPGNQGSPLSAPDPGSVDMSINLGEAAQLFNQSRLMQAQVQAVNANTVKSQNQASLSALQARVLERNPLLSDTGYNAIIDALKATAETKMAESAISKTRSKWFNQKHHGKLSPQDIMDSGDGSETGYRKMDAELALLMQRFNLNDADSAIKAQVLKSKDFQNEILEVQKRFMTDAEITPQHIMQFIQLFLMKLL